MVIQKPDRNDPQFPIAVGGTMVESPVGVPEGPPALSGPQVAPKEGHSHLKRLHWTAATMIVAALVQSIPIGCYGDSTTPVWMRALLILAASQVAFWLWVVLLPDWSTMWIATLVVAGVSAFYAFALAIAVATPVGEPDVLEMNDLRDLAQLWLTAMLVVCGTMSLACGQFSFQWRKAIG